ncbi:hybrid sensor histidine kinase/response regulator [Cryptosporangium japonicum]|uniref:histidine kinase n=1 Tax=Cryptosporangium japonicum TaxID=80872 RepID=A0ABN0TGA9_9ACTN
MMGGLFGSRRWRVSERGKVTLLAAALALPLLVVSAAYVGVEHGRLTSGRLERAGADYLVPLSRLATAVTLARHTVAAGGRGDAAEIDALVRSAEEVDTREGRALGVRAEWRATAAAVRTALQPRSRRVTVANYNLAVDRILALMTHVRDPSTALDGDVDTYYVMNAAIYQLPVLLDTPLRAIDAVLLDTASGTSTGAAGLAPIAAMAGRTTVLTNSLANNLKRAFAATGSEELRGLQRLADRAVATHRQGAQFVLRTAAAGRPLAVEAALLEPMIEQTTALSAALLPVLRHLIDARITTLEHRIYGVGAATGLAVLIASYALMSSLRGMRRDRDRAVAAAAAQAAFLATMSHEIRTPLNAVIGMTGVLMDTDLDADQRDYVTTVRDSGEALLSTINDILDFSKIESGELDLDDEPFDVQECVDSALALVALEADRKGLELVGAVENCSPTVRGDVTRLRQILVNLLSNAVKFTERGEVVVTTTAQPLTDDPAGRVRLRVAVRDTGPGIPPDRMHRVFRSFAQVDSSTTRVHGGTGLGLAISRRLARAMGGDITVDSAVGAGSTFVATAIVTSWPDDAVTDADDGRLVGASALVVDDNATNRRVLCLQLGGWGLRCVEAASAADARALVDAGERFDVAVLDLQMPEHDGLELARALRTDARTAGLPLILLSSIYWRPTDADRTLFVAMLSKPARAALLRDHLRRALARPAEPRDVSSSRSGVPSPSAALRILLAEDNPVNQKVAQLLLAKLGQRVDTVANGAEALQAVQRVPYDLVLMDVQMPVMDGLEATRRIRSELPPERHPCIVAMTASVLVEDRNACSAAGMDDYLPKPVRAQDLHAVISRLTGRIVPGEHPVTADQSRDPAREEEIPDAIQRRIRDLIGPTTDPEEQHFLAGMLRAFTTTGDQLLSEIDHALHTDDHQAALAGAHRLKGSAANLGLDDLAQALGDLEEALQGIPPGSGRLEHLVTAARTDLHLAGPHLLHAADALEEPGTVHANPD